jgi:transcriptional antiterminator NusG
VNTEGKSDTDTPEAVNGAGVVTASSAGEQPAAPVVPENAAMRWFVVQAFSGFEGVVQRSLKERIERAGAESKFGEILVPTEEVVEIRNGQKRRSERKFFPGYVLVRMEMDDETWHLVKDVPKVLGFIGGTANRPAPISDKEADHILQRVQEGVEKPRPKVLFDVGEVVRVTDGPFNDFNGVVEEVNFDKNRLLVAVQIFGRSTPVELEFSQVEKA